MKIILKSAVNLVLTSKNTRCRLQNNRIIILFNLQFTKAKFDISLITAKNIMFVNFVIFPRVAKELEPQTCMWLNRALLTLVNNTYIIINSNRNKHLR